MKIRSAKLHSRRAAQATNLLFRGGIIVGPCRLLLHSDRIPRSLSDATAQSKTMQIPSPTTMVPFLTTILVSAAVQAIGAPFSDTRVTAPSTSPPASRQSQRKTADHTHEAKKPGFNATRLPARPAVLERAAARGARGYVESGLADALIRIPRQKE